MKGQSKTLEEAAVTPVTLDYWLRGAFPYVAIFLPERAREPTCP